MDIGALTDQLMPYLTSAIAAYGVAVAAKTQDTIADETVGLGRRLLQRILTRKESQPQIDAAITDLAQTPEDGDAAAALRLQVRKALMADPVLVNELVEMLPPTSFPSRITAVGQRAAAVGINTGVIQFGDHSTTQR
jgi:hypothetical protein